eukprot:15465418-Alexandrium_andersonii.AAC.1
MESQRNMIDATREQAAAAQAQSAALVANASAAAAAPADPSTGASGAADDRLNALAGIKFEQAMPVIKDSDPDFDKHWRNVQSVIDCHSFGRRG